MACDDACDTGLGLGLGLHESIPKYRNLTNCSFQEKKKPCLRYDQSLPSLTLGGPSENTLEVNKESSITNMYKLQASSLKAISTPIKGDRQLVGEEEEKVSSRVSDEDEEGSPRKKLRLTKEQASVLEESYKEHSTINPKQKQALAKKLNLQPRQVEVWFQNRRARTKLKQTEVDRESWKKCYDELTQENERLQKELQELKRLVLKTPIYMQLPAATLTLCPSCEIRLKASSDGPPVSPCLLGQKPLSYSTSTASHTLKN